MRWGRCLNSDPPAGAVRTARAKPRSPPAAGSVWKGNLAGGVPGCRGTPASAAVGPKLSKVGPWDDELVRKSIAHKSEQFIDPQNY